MDRYSTGFGDLLRSLTAGLPAEQLRLDEDYLERTRAAQAVLRHLPSGCEALVPTLAPSRSYLAEVRLTTQLRFVEQNDRELGAGVGVDVLSLGYRRRFAHSGLTSNTVSVLVRQVPLPPRPGDEEE